ncbi:MAG: hypothetical protein HYY19_05510 [Candidatus Rokubacteria bacterium]|nr:hypothetical protein [Candidatus Rokubacteria bacterium]
MRGARIVTVGLVLGGLLGLAGPGAGPASACCDWTPQDREFWDKMSENPQQFSYDMGARLTHFKLGTGGEEAIVTPESAQKDDLWRHVLHHLHDGPAHGHGHDAASHSSPRGVRQ